MNLEDHLSWRSSLPTGWRALYDQLAHDVAAADEDAIVEDAKQKFGELRVYLDRLTPVTEVLVDEATRQSKCVSERCGGPGERIVPPYRYHRNRASSTAPTWSGRSST